MTITLTGGVLLYSNEVMILNIQADMVGNIP